MRLFIISIFILVKVSLYSQDVSSSIQAVLILGSSAPSSFESELEKIAIDLERRNISVQRLYAPNNKWEDIKKASLNTSIFIYCGHGTELGLDGGYGGIVVDEFISAEQILNELKFNNNPLVLFQFVCGGAGTSIDDYTDIGLKEAQKRIIGSAKPFLKNGAAGYFANNYSYGIIHFFDDFFVGENLSNSYKIEAERWCEIEKNAPLYDKDLANKGYYIGISSSSSDEMKEYHIAYIGKPSLTINQIISSSKK